MQPSAVERLLAHDRVIVIATLVLSVILAACYILLGAGTGMSSIDMSAGTGPAGALLGGTPDMVSPHVWSLRYGAVVFVMWWLMMIAMMVPSAAPTVLLYGAFHRERGGGAALNFLAGYLAVWGVFSLLATLLQAILATGGMISAMYMNLATVLMAAMVLICTGAYQLSPIKAACLEHCRGPVASLTRHRRTGWAAAFRMGVLHGRYCLGCCWALMALLFVGGIMNIWWIVAITVYVAIEKLAPGGKQVSRIMGGALIVCGLALLARESGAL